MRSLYCLAIVLSAAFLLQASFATTLSNWVEGQVLYFRGPADGGNPNQPSGALVQGACGYGPFDLNSYPNYRIASISPQNPLAANATRHPLIGCGACLEIQCIGSTCPPNGGEINPLFVMVVDSCRTCTANQLVIPFSIFNVTLTNSPTVGTAAVRYRQVDCEPRGPIVIDVDTYRPTEGGYIRLSLESVAGSGALRSVELRGSSDGGGGGGGKIESENEGDWLPMVNTYGAKWELSNLPRVPIDVRVISDNGTVEVQEQAINEVRTGGFATFIQFTTNPVAAPPPAVVPPAVVPPPSPPPSAPPAPPGAIENPFSITPTP